MCVNIQADRKLEKDRAKAKKRAEQSWSSWAGSWFYTQEEDAAQPVTKGLSGGYGQVIRTWVWFILLCTYRGRHDSRKAEIVRYPRL